MEEHVSQWFPRVLVIGPGGVQGLKVLGFLAPLEDAKFLRYIDTYCGVSVGAIISLLIVAGYQIREIVGEASNLNIFKDLENLTLQSIVEHRGFISNEPVRSRLIHLLVNKFGNVPTLRGLYLQTGKSLVTVTLNATDEQCVMMSPHTHPHISCVDAVMFSMNIPFVFYQLVHNGKTYVDGALANPYPVDYFDDGNTNILGIYIKSNMNKPPPAPVRTAPIIMQKIDTQAPISVGSYSYKIIHALMDQRRNHIMQSVSNRCKHVVLDINANIDPIGCTIGVQEKANMLVEGFNSGKEFIELMLNDQYEGPPIPPKETYPYPQYYLLEDETGSAQQSQPGPSQSSG